MRGLQGDLQISGFAEEKLLAPEQALTLFFASAEMRAPQIDSVGLDDAAGRVLARPIASEHAFPAAPRSAMDGFAVRAYDVPGDVRIAGEIRMGAVRDAALEARTAVRIPTGGTLPPGADAIVPVEDVEISGDVVHVASAIEPGACVVPAGSDMRAGEIVLERGKKIGAAETAVLAALGIVDVPVYRIPRIAIISSGDELVEVRRKPNAAQVRDSNRWALAAKLRALGATVEHYPIAPDEERRYEELVRTAITNCDGLILTGGSSVGLRDLTPHIVDRQGPPGVIVHGLKVRPGKPTLLASSRGKPIVGLPGNPTSALTIMEIVAAPIVLQLAGARALPVRHRAVLAEPYTKRAGWTWFVPVRLEDRGPDCLAYPLELRSNSTSLLARASGFAILGETVEQLAAGENILVQRFL